MSGFSDTTARYALNDTSLCDMIVEVPVFDDVLPDGTPTEITGDPEGFKRFNHLQGDNTLGKEGTCGLVSCEDILRQFGVNVTEDEIVRYATDNGLCADSGGSSAFTQAKILSDFGVPAKPDFGCNLDDMAAYVTDGKAVIIEANAGVLWDDPRAWDGGGPNHAVVVTGVARDTGDPTRIQGFFINDSGSNKSGRFVEADRMREAWEDAGGVCVVTEGAHQDGSPVYDPSQAANSTVDYAYYSQGGIWYLPDGTKDERNQWH